jgi:hypothetical protein
MVRQTGTLVTDQIKPNLEFVCWGPPARGLPRTGDLVYCCATCRTTKPADHASYFSCACGAMRLDFDAGRFGSSGGDQAILTYRVIRPSGA